MSSSPSRLVLCALVALPAAACLPTIDGVPDGGLPGGRCPGDPFVETLVGCGPAPNDYLPRLESSAFDVWPACISDDNELVPVDPAGTAAAAEVQTFIRMGNLLWRNPDVPEPTHFAEARATFEGDTPDLPGLEAKVRALEDWHHPPSALGGGCATEGVPAQSPERCVGAATLLPLIDDALTRGEQGEAPLEQAARIEAALLWFFYTSALAEVMTCTFDARDCDDVWAYYQGGTRRDSPLGLGAYIDVLGNETHDRAFDALLAVRCWRDLDPSTTVTDVDSIGFRDAAFAQLDRATLRGLALVARDRFTRLDCPDAEAARAELAFLKVLVPLLDRAARARIPEKADVLRAQVEQDHPAQVDIAAATGALDALFACP